MCNLRLDFASPSISTLHIGHLLSHGKQVAAEGSVEFPDGSTQHFAHFITFNGHGRNAKINEVFTYLTEVY